MKATAYSMNTVFVGLNDDVEPENTLKAAIDAGIPEDTVGLNDELLNVLGPSSPHNIDLTTAYSTIANGGERVTAHIVKKVEDSNNKLLYSGDVAPKRVFEVEEVSSIMPALEAVTTGEGTANRVDASIARLTTAGKTGTSSDQLSAQSWASCPAWSPPCRCTSPTTRATPCLSTTSADLDSSTAATGPWTCGSTT